MRLLLIALVGILVESALPPAKASAQQTVPRLDRAACPFELGEWTRGANIECSWLVVPESRAQPNSRSIRLAVAVIRSWQPSGAPPLVMLHGGPGASGLNGLPARVINSPLGIGRDVVIYDQRGSGFSEPKLCPEYDAVLDAARALPTAAERAERRAQGTRACVASLRAGGTDPASYNTGESALDLIDLRVALGYQRWDLHGGSYGARLAQEVMVRDAAAVRAALLLWPVPRGGADHAGVAATVHGVFEHLFTSCERQRSCAEAFPSLREDFYRSYDELVRAPLFIPHGPAGADTVRLDGPRLVAIIRNQVMDRPIARLRQLPLLLHELRAGDRQRAAETLVGFVPVGGGESGTGSAEVLRSLINCYDIYSPEYIATHDSLNAAVPAPFRSDYEADCPIWQERFADAAARAPVAREIPTLIITAEWDDRTPTVHGRRIAESLSRAYVIEIPGAAHGNVPPVPNRCVEAVMMQFLSDPLRAPDASCIQQLPRVQFSTTWGGG